MGVDCTFLDWDWSLNLLLERNRLGKLGIKWKSRRSKISLNVCIVEHTLRVAHFWLAFISLQNSLIISFELFLIFVILIFVVYSLLSLLLESPLKLSSNQLAAILLFQICSTIPNYNLLSIRLLLVPFLQHPQATKLDLCSLVHFLLPLATKTLPSLYLHPQVWCFYIVLFLFLIFIFPKMHRWLTLLIRRCQLVWFISQWVEAPLI